MVAAETLVAAASTLVLEEIFDKEPHLGRSSHHA